MNDQDLKRLMAQNFLIYKKLVEIQDKVKGKTVFHADNLLVKDFNDEVDKIMRTLNV